MDGSKDLISPMKKEYITPKEVARYDPWNQRGKLAEETANELLGEPATTPSTEVISPPTAITPEQAKEILGNDFLGVEAIRKMENKLKTVGVDVQFETDPLPNLPYSEQDLKLARENGEMLVLRTETMTKSGERISLTLIGFRELFRKDPLGKMPVVVRALGPGEYDLCKGSKFATSAKEIKLDWSLVKKDLLDGSTKTNWTGQEQLLRQYEIDLKRNGASSVSVRRRTATEAVYDTLLYYVNSGEKLLPEKTDWTKTRPVVSVIGEILVCVGDFSPTGLLLYYHDQKYANGGIGVCPTR